MRVVIAPDKFAGTLTAVEAARAVADGWRRWAPDDDLVQVPMSDGGPGFVSVLHEALGGDLLTGTVTGPMGEPTPITSLRVGETVYLESAQAIGLHLVPEADRNPEVATTRGLGEAMAAAVDAGARRLVIGLGGSATNDGGAGVLAALGAIADVPLDQGPAPLANLTSLDLEPARSRLDGVEIVVASDVEFQLTGLLGATKQFGAQKGLPEERMPEVDGWLEKLGSFDRSSAATKGAGAAGGVGFALITLGGSRQPGIDLVADAVGLGAALRGADLVITGEGAFDFSSRAGKVPYGVAQVAIEAVVPCVVIAGRVLIGAREMRALGVEAAYSMSERAGAERSLAEPAAVLGELAERVARSWSR